MNKAFHIHTHRCRHMRDNNKEEEYIKKAIQLGAVEIWFTDHAPFPENPFNNRMLIEELPEYIETLQTLKQKYDSTIDVKIGLEIEYLPNYYEYYKKLYDSKIFDVLLLGQHFSFLPDGRYTFSMDDKSDEAKLLANGLIEGMKTGFFSVVAHPDQIFRNQKVWNDEMEKIAQEIKQCANDRGISLEKNICNFYGKEKKNSYRMEFWKDLPNRMKTIYGLDAHAVKELEEFLDYAEG